LRGNSRRGLSIASSPAFRGQVRNQAAATLSQIKFFHSMWTNLFAVAGTREHPPAGVIRKRGAKCPLLYARRTQRHRTPPAKYGRTFALLRAPAGKNVPTAACV